MSAESPLFHLALVEPEIPGNTGNIGRLAVGLGVPLHLVRPLGFSLDEKHVRRAGIDHWRKVDLVVHDDLAAFLDWAQGRRILPMNARAEAPYTTVAFQRGDVLLFGRESVGLPTDLVDRFGGWAIPTPGAVRSLNLSNAAAVVAYEALRQLAPQHFAPETS